MYVCMCVCMYMCMPKVNATSLYICMYIQLYEGTLIQGGHWLCFRLMLGLVLHYLWHGLWFRILLLGLVLRYLWHWRQHKCCYFRRSTILRHSVHTGHRSILVFFRIIPDIQRRRDNTTGCIRHLSGIKASPQNQHLGKYLSICS